MLRSLSSVLGRPARNLARDRRGSALLEAALVMPILVSLFLGLNEYGEGLTASRRVEMAAGTTADLVARLRSVSTAELSQIKPLVDEMLRPFPADSLRLVITSVVADDDNTTTVAWSHAEGGGTPRAQGASVSVPGGLTEPGGSVIVAEVQYTFRSTLATLIVGDIQMQAEGFSRPRLSAQIEKAD
jgi:Flp pilus assembly protein TadG